MTTEFARFTGHGRRPRRVARLLLDATGTLTTTVSGQAYTQPANGT